MPPHLLKMALKDSEDFTRKKLEVVKKTGLGKEGKACWGRNKGNKVQCGQVHSNPWET